MEILPAPPQPPAAPVNASARRGLRDDFQHLRQPAAFACVMMALLLWIPANLLPFLTTSVAGVSRQSVLSSSLGALVHDGVPELGLVVLFVTVLLPLAHLGLTAGVLGSLAAGLRPRGLGRTFRWAQGLQVWSMTDVMLLGFVVAWARLQVTVSVTVGPGAWCFVAAAVLAFAGQALLDPAAVWRRIDDAHRLASAERLLRGHELTLAATAAPAGGDRPSHQPRLDRRNPNALGNAAALTLAALVLYVPANLYPMATLPIGMKSVSYNVTQGVIDLIAAKLYAFAALVFVASFLIPVTKLAVLAWCVGSVLIQSRRHLREKTVALKWVDRFGRWSMADPLVIACFVPVAHYNALVHASAGAAAPLFCGVVILTMCATRSFDPRLLRARKLHEAAA